MWEIQLLYKFLGSGFPDETPRQMFPQGVQWGLQQSVGSSISHNDSLRQIERMDIR